MRLSIGRFTTASGSYVTSMGFVRSRNDEMSRWATSVFLKLQLTRNGSTSVCQQKLRGKRLRVMMRAVRNDYFPGATTRPPLQQRTCSKTVTGRCHRLERILKVRLFMVVH